jgi:hypothetical protein
MAQTEFYIYLSSRDPKTFTPHTNVDFTTELGSNIHLEGDWECGVVAFDLSSTPLEPVFICCDLVRETRVGKTKIPVLRQVRLIAHQLTQVFYRPVKITDFNTIRIYMRTWRGPLKKKKDSAHTYCTLHFRQQG